MRGNEIIKKLILCLAIALLCCGCEAENEKTTVSKNGYLIIDKICIDGYLFYKTNNQFSISSGYGITQVFELVDGVTRPKMCEEVK